VQVVKHNHVPTGTKKFLGNVQTTYPMKNWSSVMLMNCAMCRALTPEYVNTATGLELHRFKWLENEDLIGEIPHRWNHLVGYDPNVPPEEIANLHFTEGGPYFERYKDCAYAADWGREFSRMMYVEAGPPT
jgi:hypothetical protein